MRNAFVDTLYDLTAQDKNIYLLTGDLGFGVLTKYWETYPDNFINAGIAEQNMTAVAAGMALEGNCVFTYSIANFSTLRCIEQIRNCVAYHNANVKIVSIGAGFAYGGAGFTHHGTEDLAMMRAIPNMVLFSPSDRYEAIAVTKAAYEWKGPCYIRLGKGKEQNIHCRELLRFGIGKGIEIMQGNSIAIFSTGAISSEAYKAARILGQSGVSIAFCTFPTVKPIDSILIEDYAKKCSLIITVEEHNVIGGFGSAVTEVVSAMPKCKSVIKRIGLQDKFSSVIGDQAYLREYYQMTAEDIVRCAKAHLSM